MKSRLLTALVAVAALALVSSSAKASLIGSFTGSTQPMFSDSTHAWGYIDFAVYSLTGGSSDPYGAGITASTLSGAGFDPTSKYLYLFEDVNKDKDIAQSTVALNAPVTGSGYLSGEGFRGASAPSPVAIAGNQSGYALQSWTISSPGGLVNPSSVVTGLFSEQANFVTNLDTANGQVSSLWGYTSIYRPAWTTGSIEDHGSSAVGTVPGALTPEPSSLVLAGIGALGLIGYGVRRRKALGA